MTGLSRVFDAAFPPQAAPPGVTGVLGYLGGPRAAHVWTLGEWQRFGTLLQFPCWVPATATDNPVQSAIQACNAAKELGWAPMQAAKRVIVCDLETEVVRAWYAMFAAEVEQQGFTSVAYGSLSTILANAASDVWVAAWDGTPALLPGQTVHAHQYFAGNTLDYSVCDEWLMARGGQGPRHA